MKAVDQDRLARIRTNFEKTACPYCENGDLIFRRASSSGYAVFKCSNCHTTLTMQTEADNMKTNALLIGIISFAVGFLIAGIFYSIELALKLK